MQTNDGNAANDPGFFDGRLLIEILRWDANLHVGLSSPATPPEDRFQGGLAYARSFQIEGRIVAPRTHRGKAIRVWLSPFGTDMRFGPEDMDEVGRLHVHQPQRYGFDSSATLHIPEGAMPLAATCLGSTWKYVHLWTFDDDGEQASVSSFSFSSTVHKNLQAWVGLDDH